MNALPIQMARDVAAMSQVGSPSFEFLRFMRDGAYDDSDASVRAALLGIQAGRLAGADLSGPSIVELLDALRVACDLIDSAERETNWASGDPCGDSATVELRAVIRRAGGAA